MKKKRLGDVSFRNGSPLAPGALGNDARGVPATSTVREPLNFNA
jgi:hypothetical protein